MYEKWRRKNEMEWMKELKNIKLARREGSSRKPSSERGSNGRKLSKEKEERLRKNEKKEESWREEIQGSFGYIYFHTIE